MSLPRIYAIVFGVVYTLVGLVGFAVSSTLEVYTLIIFPVNVLHNIVHLLVGIIGIAAFLTAARCCTPAAWRFCSPFCLWRASYLLTAPAGSWVWSRWAGRTSSCTP